MANACRVCESPHLAVIDRLLAEGRAQRAVASRFGVTKDSVNRHVRNQHSVPGDLDGDADDGLGDEATPAQMMRSALKRLRQVDLRRMTPNQVVQHAQAIRQISTDLAKVEEDPRKVVRLGVNDVEGMGEFIGLLFELLEPHPEIRQRLLTEMEARGVFAGSDR